MADLETLTLRITQESSKAFNAIDKLAKRLDGLSVAVAKLEVGKLNDLARGLVNLNSAIVLIKGATSQADYTRIFKELSTIGNVDSGRLDTLSASLVNLSAAFQTMSGATSVTSSVRELINAVGKLGGVAVERAIINIPQLETALGHLITSFSTLPEINQSVIDFTNSLGNLASQGSRVGTATNAVTNSLERFGATTTRATRRAHSLASTIGTLYAKFWLLMRGATALKNSFLSAADYLEAFNYFDVTAKKIGKDTFAKAGVGSAEDYADAFTSTLQEKLKKMSGLELDLEDRLIKTTNAKSLGLNITEITQYQAAIASLTNSMGVTQEIAEASSKALSMLAGDIASLRNMDFSEVASKLQSGLTGMARSLYSFGIDITNATLQEYAYANGIEKAVSEMSQSEKAQLRLLAILDQSKVAWGDLANTINSPSNQLRMLKTNLKEVGTVFGQLFIPVMQSVLPVLNGLSLAIKQLMVDIAQLLGIKLDLDSFGTFGDEVDADVESVEDLNSAIKETKKGIRDFDELKVINDSKNKNSGLGAEIDLTKQIVEATNEYEKVWDEAYARMTSKAQEIAGYISSAFEPIKRIIEDFHVGDFFKAGEDVSQLVISIFDFISDAIDQVNWTEIGNKIGAFLEGLDWVGILKSIGGLIGNALQAAIDIWTGMFDVAPFETAILTAFALLKFTGLGAVIKTNLGNLLGDMLASGRLTKEILQKTGLGLISMGIGIALTIDNVEDISVGEYSAWSLTNLLKSAVSALFTGAGFSLAASAIGLMSGGLAFAIGAAITLAVNLIVGMVTEPSAYDEIKKITEAENEWITKNNLDRMEIKTDIDLRGAITQESLNNIDELAQKVWEMSQNYDNLTNAQKGMLKEYSDQLVRAVPGITNSIDQITGAYKGTYDQLQELIEKEKEQILLESYRQNLADVTSGIASANRDINKINQTKQEREQARSDIEDLMKSVLGDDYSEFLFKDLIEYSKDSRAWTLEHGTDNFGKRLMQVQNAMSKIDASGNTKFLSYYVKALTEEEDLDKKLKETKDTLADLTEEQEYWLGEMGKMFEETFSNITPVVEEGIDGSVKVVEKQKLPTAIHETLKNVDDKIKKDGKISEQDMNTLFTHINTSFVGLGVGEVPKEMQDTMTAIKAAILTGSPDLIKLMGNLKRQMEEAFVNAHYDNNGNVIWNVNNISGRLDNDVKSIEEALDHEAKPTLYQFEKDLHELFGENLPESVDGALKDLADTIEKGEGSKKVLKALEYLKNVTTIEAHDLGMYLMFGGVEGVYDGTPLLAGATKYAVDNGFTKTWMSETESASPSRLAMRLAEYLPEGAAIGIEKGTPKFESAVEDMIGAFQSVFKGVAYNIPSLNLGGGYSQRRFDYANMDSNNSFMSQLSGMANQMTQNGQTEVVFRVEGDPYGIFKVVREENESYRKMHHRNAW